MQKTENYRIKPDHFLEVITTKSIVLRPNEEVTNQRLLGVTDEVLHTYYSTAYSFMEQEKWDEASKAFTFLTYLNPFVHDFWICQGIAQQSQGKFQEALIAYTMAEATNSQDPTAPANAFQCAVALGEQEFAEYSLNKAIKCCGDHQDHAKLKQTLMGYKKK